MPLDDVARGAVAELTERHADLGGRGVRVVQRGLQRLAGLLVKLLKDDGDAALRPAGRAVFGTGEVI